MKRLIGGIILILFVLPGFVSAICQCDTGGIIMSLLFMAGGGTMVYYGIKSRRRCKAESLNKVDIPSATAAQKAVTPPEPPRCKAEEVKINCPHCNQTLEVPPEMLGQAADCPSCNRSILLPSAQPEKTPQQSTTDPVDKTTTVKPLKEEKCCACGSRLTVLARAIRNSGILKDEEEICRNCDNQMRSSVGLFKYKSRNFTKAEVIDRIREFDEKREEKARQKQEQRIEKQKEREAAAFEKQELKEKLQSETEAETRKVQEQIQNAKSYSVGYLGGIPGADPENHIEICATPSGIYAFMKEAFSKNMKELFLIEWKCISGISHSSTTKGSDATKNALLTAGLVRNSGVAVLGGFLCNGQKTEEHITITCRDDTGYESEILFRSRYYAQEIALYLNAQRAVLYKPEKTPATQTAVENPVPVADSIEQLKKLAELKNTGIITEEEFGMKKAELLTRI